MKPASEDVRKEFIRLWSQLARTWGISAATARVYAWLFTQPDGGDVDEIMAGLTVGRGTVSTSCRELRDWSLIISDQLPGSRRTRYRVETDLARVIRGVVLHRKAREWDPILENTRHWIPRLETDRSPAAGLFRERLRALAGCLSLADAAVMSFLDGNTVADVDLRSFTRPELERPTARRPRPQPEPERSA